MPTPGGPTSVMIAPSPRARRPPVAWVTVVDAAIVAELAGGEELDDAVLHIGQAVVVGVEHEAGRGEVERVVAALAPRQLEDPVEPGADPGVFGRLGAHPFETVELLGDGRLHALGGVERFELGAEVADHVVVTLAQFLADGVELLAQQPFTLLLVDPFADVVADRLGDLQLGEVVARPRVDGVDAIGQVDGTEHHEPVGVGELGPRGHGVGQFAGGGGGAQDLGQAPRAAQFADEVERGPQLAGGGVDRRGAGRIGRAARPRRRWPGRWATASASGGRGRRSGRGLDLDDRRRLAVGQVADVGDPGDDAERVLVAAGQDQAAGGVGAAWWRLRRRGGVHRC